MMDQDTRKFEEIIGRADSAEPTRTIWPPDEAMRSQCLRMAIETTRRGEPGEILKTAMRFYAFIKGVTE